MGIKVLHDRLYQCLGGSGSASFPFERINVLPPATSATPSSLTGSSYASNYPLENSAKGGSATYQPINEGGGAYSNRYYRPVINFNYLMSIN